MELTKCEVIIFSLYKQFILKNSKCECVRRDRPCCWWQQKVYFFFFRVLTFVSFLFNCKWNWQTEFSEEIIGHSWNSHVTLLASSPPTHSLHVSHKFYTIPVIVLLVFKPSLYRLNWKSWRLRNNRFLWNAYCNLLKHILRKHNRHQNKIIIHRWLSLALRYMAQVHFPKQLKDHKY